MLSCEIMNLLLILFVWPPIYRWIWTDYQRQTTISTTKDRIMYPSSFSVQIEVQSSKIAKMDLWLNWWIFDFNYCKNKVSNNSIDWKVILNSKLFFRKKSNEPSIYITKYQRVHDPALIESRIKFFRGCQYVDGNAVA